eukprot:tig00021339_g20417.t1
MRWRRVVLAASSASAACVASPLRHRNGCRSAAAAVAVRRGVTPWRDSRGAGGLQRVCAFNPLKSLTCMRCVSLHGSDAGAGTAPGPGGACRRGRGGAPAPAPARGGALGGQPYSRPGLAARRRFRARHGARRARSGGAVASGRRGRLAAVAVGAGEGWLRGQGVEGAERLRSRTAFAAGAAHRLQPSASAPQAPGPPDAALRALSSRRPAGPLPPCLSSSAPAARPRPPGFIALVV